MIGIIFDLDGTLWDVTDSTYKCANIVAKKHGLKEINKKTICNAFGLNKEESAKMYFPDVDIDTALKLIDESSLLNIEYLKEYGGKIYSGLKETLNKLSDYELFIVSNTAEDDYIKAFLTSSGLEKYFKDYIAASKYKMTKAEGIKKVIIDYKLDKAIYVGDTEKDLEACEKADVDFIWVKYGFGKNIKAKYSVDEVSKLPNVINEMLKKDVIV